MTSGPGPGGGSDAVRGDTAAPESVDVILGELARAPGSPLGPGPWTHLRRPRLGSRATVLFLESQVPVGGRTRWVVKQPDVSWVRDDLARPVTARQEYDALRRLHEHFRALGGPVRVAEPVALFPDIDALAMEYVPGRPLSRLLRQHPMRDPAPMLEAVAGTAQFIRGLHGLEELPPTTVDLGAMAERTLSVAAQRLHPLGLSLPRRTSEVLSRVPALRVSVRQVRLHGDFGPTNLMLAEDGAVVGIDASLDAVGAPEEDLARFIVTMSCALRMAPGVIAPRTRRVRRQLESRFLSTYYPSGEVPPLFELTLLHALVLRWPRLREFAQRRQRRLLPLTWRVIGAQVRQLMVESSDRLARDLDRAGTDTPSD